MAVLGLEILVLKKALTAYAVGVTVAQHQDHYAPVAEITVAPLTWL